MRTFIALVLTLLATQSVIAQAPGKSRVPVFLSQDCKDDVVGQRVAYNIKEGLNRSTSMISTEDYSDSILAMRLLCLSPDADDAGRLSIYSYSITLYNLDGGYYDYLITGGVGTCGTKRVSECAEGLVANIDQALSDVRKHLNDGSFKLPSPKS